MSTLTLYSHPHSRGIRVQKLLEVFEIPHELKTVDFHAGETRTPEYLKIHPYGRVPALLHGETTVLESGAITLYLADAFPAELKAPAPGTVERARLYEWLLFFQSTLEQVAVESFAAEDKSKSVEKIRELLSAMAGRFVGPYVLGEEFTMLDVILNVELSWYRITGIYPDGLEPYESFLNRTNHRMNWPEPVSE